MIRTLGIILVLGIILTGGTLFLAPQAHPDFPPLYKVKRLEEKVIEKTKHTPQARADYDAQLLQNRLEDIQYVTSNKEYGLFLGVSLRYGATAGTLRNFILTNRLHSKNSSTIQLFKTQQASIQKLLSKKGDQEEWKFIQDDVNYLTIYQQGL